MGFMCGTTKQQLCEFRTLYLTRHFPTKWSNFHIIIARLCISALRSNILVSINRYHDVN